MPKQFPVKRFARGVKLTTQHVNEPLVAMQAAADEANLQDVVETQSRFKLSWVLPWTGPASASNGSPIVSWPFLAPPFQQLFNSMTLQDPQYPVSLTEFSLSIDQRAEPFAVTGYGAAGGVGELTNVDMSRYNMTLRLFERQPSFLTGDVQSVEEIGKWEIDGVNAFGIQQSATGGTAGSGVARANPLVISEQNLPIRPWNVYVWELSCPGLYETSTTGTKDKWTITLGGSPSAGDVLQLSINGEVYEYIVLAGNTLPVIAAGLVAAAAADPLYNVTAVNNVITLEEIVASSAVNSIACNFVLMTTTGTGTTFLTHVDTGVAGVTNDPLELVSLHLCATLEAPLTVRDKQGDFGNFPEEEGSKPIQNLPTVHGGAKTGTSIPYTTVVPNDIITGNDVQDGMHGFDRALRQRAGSGYGTGYGALADPLEASNTYPEEMLANDAHYSIIMVPMWGGQYRESVRKLTVTNAGLPYVDLEVGPANKVTEDVFVLPVPEGFVLHHAFAVWNGYSPSTIVYPGCTDPATWPTDAGYTQKVGVILNSGWRSDDYKHQQVAYLQWNGAAPAGNPDSYKNWLLDEYSPDGNPRYRLLQIPLVNDTETWDSNSWFSSGPPFYMGRANTMTEDREVCGTMPTGYPGCVAFATPLTNGRENVLEVRWTKDLTEYAALENTDTIIGQGGEWVVLCGKQVLTA